MKTISMLDAQSPIGIIATVFRPHPGRVSGKEFRQPDARQSVGTVRVAGILPAIRGRDALDTQEHPPPQQSCLPENLHRHPGGMDDVESLDFVDAMDRTAAATLYPSPGLILNDSCRGDVSSPVFERQGDSGGNFKSAGPNEDGDRTLPSSAVGRNGADRGFPGRAQKRNLFRSCPKGVLRLPPAATPPRPRVDHWAFVEAPSTPELT